MARLTLKSLAVWLVFVGVFSSSAEAGGLKKKERWNTINSVLKPKFDAAAKACGVPIAFVIDEASFKDEIYATDSKSPFLCEWVPHLVKQWCEMEDKTRKQAIVAQVKKVVCRFGGKGNHKFELKKDGTFEWTIDYEHLNSRPDDVAQEMADYLREAL